MRGILTTIREPQALGALFQMPAHLTRRAPRVSVILPCLDEAAGVAASVREAQEGLHLAGLLGEVIVVDNGSRDGSALVAARSGARVHTETRRGYGAAIRKGLEMASGEIVVVADADRSYDLRQLGDLVRRVVDGADLVVGARLPAHSEPGAMPRLHRRIGLPALNMLLIATTGRRFDDSQSGFRAFHRDRLLQLCLRADGMEFASEMLVRAHHAGLRVEEVPVRYRQRAGTSKLRPLADGMRHLCLLLRLGSRYRLTRRTR